MPIEYNASVWTDASDGNGGSPPLTKLTRLEDMLPKGYCESKGIVIRQYDMRNSVERMEVTSFGDSCSRFVGGLTEFELYIVIEYETCMTVPVRFNLLRKAQLSSVGDRFMLELVISDSTASGVWCNFRDFTMEMFGDVKMVCPSMIEMLEFDPDMGK